MNFAVRVPAAPIALEKREHGQVRLNLVPHTLDVFLGLANRDRDLLKLEVAGRRPKCATHPRVALQCNRKAKILYFFLKVLLFQFQQVAVASASGVEGKHEYICGWLLTGAIVGLLDLQPTIPGQKVFTGQCGFRTRVQSERRWQLRELACDRNGLVRVMDVCVALFHGHDICVEENLQRFQDG
ncbi:hypothetical protein D3C81_1731900 [compost metagenome]